MAQVRCPLCSQLNPEELEECQFCQARLKPLVVPPFEGDEEGTSALDEGEPDQALNLPEWLRELSQQEPEEGEVEEVEPEEVIPDWLKSMGSAISEAESESELLEKTDSDVMPDWLARLGAHEASSSDETDASETPVQEDGVPDWLLKIRERQQDDDGPEESDDLDKFSEEDASPEMLEAGESEIQQPDLADEQGRALDIDSGQGKSGPQFEQAFQVEPGSEQDELAGTEERPDWLTELEDQPGTEQETEEGPSIEDEGPLEEAETGLALSFQQEDEPDGEDLSGGLPDWISQVAPEDTLIGGVSEPDVDDEASLAPAELPGWLEAMRPVEAAAPAPPPVRDQSEGIAEKAGPLSGLKNVLQAEPDFAAIKKPSVYSIKLQVTEHQQAHAALLEQLLETENLPKEVPERSGAGSLAVLRWFIAVLLVVVVLLPRWIGTGWFTITESASAEASIADSLIGSLPQGAPVLVAFDYELAMSGEMDAAAEGVIGRLMIRNSRLALVTTLPSGPINAQRFMTSLDEQLWRAEAAYYNLGYISGGAAGLRGFAENPRSVFPYTIDTKKIWELQNFQDIHAADGFDMVVVITENPEVARNWIEQVQPVLQNNQVPLVMVVSTQAEPMVRPYYTGVPQQVSALVSGLPGGAAFEQLRHIPGDVRFHGGKASERWDSYGAGMLAAVLLLALGSISAAAVNLYSTRKDAKDEASL
jgi:hypothetical protein